MTDEMFVMFAIAAGIALYAIDSLLMSCPRPWNYKEIFLDERR